MPINARLTKSAFDAKAVEEKPYSSVGKCQGDKIVLESTDLSLLFDSCSSFSVRSPTAYAAVSPTLCKELPVIFMPNGGLKSLAWRQALTNLLKVETDTAFARGVGRCWAD